MDIVHNGDSSTPNVLDEIANFIFTSKYSRYREDLNRRETWNETVDRVESMHLQRYHSKLSELDIQEIKTVFNHVRNKKLVPSMRSMQYGGKAQLQNNARGYNCAVRHVDCIRAFSELFFLMLSGCGVGAGITKKYISQLPNLVADMKDEEIVFTPEDTIEGWADCLEVLMKSYTVGNELSGRKIVFDFSSIRPKGSILKTSGGKAPGPYPLSQSMIRIRALLDSKIKARQVSLKAIDVCDILCFAADAVLSGGARRSAMSMIFDKDDDEMINAKIGNWQDTNPQRARSNNSVLLLRDQTSESEFADILKKTKEWGEPGFVFAQTEDTLYNPCFTKSQLLLTEDGWRSFGELIGQNPKIHQDARVEGRLENGQEVWDFVKAQHTVINQGFDVRKTGDSRNVLRLITEGGRIVEATDDHDFATRTGMRKLGELLPGDSILVGVPEHHHSNLDSEDFVKGFVSGLFVGDGCNSKNEQYNIDFWQTDGREDDLPVLENYINKTLDKSKSFKKVKSESQCQKWRLGSAELMHWMKSEGVEKHDDWSWLHSKSKDFKAGFVSGLIYTDGHVEGNSNKSVSLRITQSNEDALKTLLLIVQELGYFSKIKEFLPERHQQFRISQKSYKCKASFRLMIGGKQLLQAFDTFLFLSSDASLLKSKLSGYKNNTNYNTYYDRVKAVESMEPEDVYCLSEEIRRTCIVQGLTARRCFEVGFVPVTEDGRTGVQMCNLTSINGAKINTVEDFFELSKAAAIIGTLQAGYTSFPYLSDTARELTEDEALLGVSIIAMMENKEILLSSENQRQAARIVVSENRRWSSKLGINPAARCTVIKPDGTCSLALGTLSAGVHPVHSRRMFKRIQVNKLDNTYQFFKQYNPHLCEESIWNPNKTDDVITFPVENPPNVVIKDDLSAIEHLEYVKLTQLNWVMSGDTERNRKPVTHNVSCTITVADDEWDKVQKYLYDNRSFFSAVSLVPKTLDKDYPQTPNESVSTEKDLEHYQNLLSLFKPVDYRNMIEIQDFTRPMEEMSCAGGACLI